MQSSDRPSERQFTAGARATPGPAGLLILAAMTAALAGCGAVESAVPGAGLAKRLVGGGSGASGDAPLVAGDLSIVQHPGSGPLVAAARIEGDLSVEQSSAGVGEPQTEEERAAEEMRIERDVLQKLLDERHGELDEAGD